MSDAFALTNKGSRTKMEDYAVLIENFNNNKDWTFGGIFDGHGGNKIAKLASEQIPKILLDKLNQKLPINKAFQETYSQFSKLAKEELIGSTALSFLLKGNKLYIANIGDCRLIGIRNGIVQQLTDDHTIDNANELERIKKCDARIYSKYIVRDLQGISVSRSFGDLYFKDLGVISEPEIFEVEIPEGSVIVAGSDGIWSILNNKEVSKFAKLGTAEEIAKNILAGILATPKEPFDNISIIVAKI